MSTHHLHPSSSRVSSRDGNSSRSSGASTPANGSSPRLTPPVAPPATERIANTGAYRNGSQPPNWPRLVASDALARELEDMSRR
ncbi:hypothetical protein PpBr36_06980 [Pyricularia pennisetigena]|uniref:hypothetical protein n=1 Tax=Pyricularia pennisetigena TaxID=1578925 RepID=UPI00114EB752|nr:hypothetical protein PpBr36_06980 [Pyricularia pennisetigena]TLS25192.1 hypothetical protein PpBr36_06980 [Pyricularia pennisetigena]